MKDLVKVQKTLINVFNYLKYKTDTEVSKRLLTEVGDAHRIVENLAITDVSITLPSDTDLNNYKINLKTPLDNFYYYLEKIDDTLTHWEDYFHGQEGTDVTEARANLDKVRKQLLIHSVSICLERAKKYARHQHFLGTQGKDLVEFEDWKAKD